MAGCQESRSASSGGCGQSRSRSKSSSGGCGGSAASPSGGCPNACGSDSPCASIPPAKPASRASSKAATSQFEKKLLCAKCPAPINETATIEVNGFKGIYVNKSEVDAFKGQVPIEKYEIYNDPNPKVINKVCKGEGQTQEVSVKFLQPPAGPAPGDIIIREKAGTAPGPAPPVIIRQEGKGGSKGKGACYRECPPPPPPKICPKLIEICAPAGSPPPRRVIVEKLPAGGAAPGPVYAERWLANEDKPVRRVVYEKAQQPGGAENPQNVIINWTLEEGEAKVVTKSLGKENADPCAYVKKYGSKLSSNLPQSVMKVKPPSGSKLASEASGTVVPKLIGDVEALKLIDLDKEGLSEYKSQVGGGRSKSRSGRSARSKSRGGKCGC